MEVAFIGLVLVSVVRGLFLFFRWAVRGLTRLGTPSPTFMPQVMPPQGVVPPQRPPLQSQRPPAQPYQPAPLDPRMAPQFTPARRTDAGGPAVLREATTASFRAEEEQLIRFEPQNTYAQAPSDVPSASSENAPLFKATSDFLRAFILQEALGPPLSRRQRN